MTHHRGFTLLELLVVVVVLSIATGLIVVKGTPGDGNLLESDARQLAQLLRVAQQEALLKSKSIRFVAGNNGYEFQELTGARWVPVKTEAALRPRLWGHGPLTTQLLVEGSPNSYLTLERSPDLTRRTVVLQKNRTRLVLESRNGGPFVASKPQVVLTEAPNR
ncbi:GspH/FimT family pseudopilin [Limnobacter humi]|uniref:Type II secretion system protein H n=1 Tax=Limnobacter humi TaxID=1778671 RepID=A0ABT1WLB9_9BURK|nr:GspH/FimT family pseudopilin [Limnobacter humi]MCQ8897639.1 GspH/FimT family pseudopilin [Limnobacter humi]